MEPYRVIPNQGGLGELLFCWMFRRRLRRPIKAAVPGPPAPTQPTNKTPATWPDPAHQNHPQPAQIQPKNKTHTACTNFAHKQTRTGHRIDQLIELPDAVPQRAATGAGWRLAVLIGRH
eukprot:366546-Chlamydomonas_euryale.AAC.41